MGTPRKTITPEQHDILTRRLQSVIDELRGIYRELDGQLPRTDNRLGVQVRQSAGKLGTTCRALAEYVRPEDH